MCLSLLLSISLGSLLITVSTRSAGPLLMRKLEPDGRCLGKWLTSDGKIVKPFPEMVTSFLWSGPSARWPSLRSLRWCHPYSSLSRPRWHTFPEFHWSDGQFGLRWFWDLSWRWIIPFLSRNQMVKTDRYSLCPAAAGLRPWSTSPAPVHRPLSHFHSEFSSLVSDFSLFTLERKQQTNLAVKPSPVRVFGDKCFYNLP